MTFARIVGKYDNTKAGRRTRQIIWVKAARKDFADFPASAQDIAVKALVLVAGGSTPDIAKPLSGIGAGVWELAIRERGGAWRVVYGLQIGDDIWVVHAFQKKSNTGIATPKHEIDLVKARIRRLRDMLK